MPQSVYLPLANKLWEKKIPIIVVKSYGLLGWIRVAMPEMLGKRNAVFNI